MFADDANDDRAAVGRVALAGHPAAALEPVEDAGDRGGNEGTVPAETIAVQRLPNDAVRKIDMPDPGNCQF